MKKFASLCLLLVCVVACLSGCTKTNTFELASNDITSIAVQTFPETDQSSRTYTATNKVANIINYINGLTLSVAPQDTTAYSGQTFVITIETTDDTQRVFYQSGNQLFWEEGGTSYLMESDEATQLQTILDEHPSD